MADYAVINPATGETVKEYPTISDDELRDAIGRADKAHRDWATSTVEERAAAIRRVGELHTERAQELAQIIVREMGKPIEQAVGEVEFCTAIYNYYADNGPSLMADEPIDLLDGEGSALVRRSSYGLLLGIMPWNYPYYQVARFAGPNLVIGNTILLKHAPQCPESALAMEQIFHEAGIPQGAYINIFATNEQIEWVIADPRVRGVSLTGSERAGAAVAAIAGRNLKKVVLELGGSDPFLVLGSDDLDATVEQAVGARLENSGQACNAAKRFIVVDELYDEFMEKFSSDPGGRRRPRRQLLRDDHPHGHQARQRRLPGGVLRAGGVRVPREQRAGGGQAGQRHAVRPGLLRDDQRLRAGHARRRPDRRRHGVRQRGGPGGGRVALWRRQAVGLRPRAWPLRGRRVRQQEDDPYRLSETGVAITAESARTPPPVPVCVHFPPPGWGQAPHTPSGDRVRALCPVRRGRRRRRTRGAVTKPALTDWRLTTHNPDGGTQHGDRSR
jgi:hypothetical protein